MTDIAIPPEQSPAETDLAELVRAHGTPLYAYDLRSLRRRVGELRSAFAGADCSLYFATMANDRPELLRVLAELNVGACVNSIPHLELALEAGFRPEATQFTSTGMPVDDMLRLQRLGIVANLDSERQLEAWFGVGGRTAGIRVNAHSFGALPALDRIGVAASELPAILRRTKPRGRIDGLHIYVGTNFREPQLMLPTLDRFFEAAATVEGLRYVNLGGGIGIDYGHTGAAFDVRAFGKHVVRLARDLASVKSYPVEVIVEPGRGIVAECGVFLTSVTDVKELGGSRFVGVDASIAIFPRPFHHPDSPHRIRAVRPSGSDGPLRSCVVVGRTTFSRDILGTAQLPADITIGDVIALDDAGAYSQSMMSRFLGQRLPATAIVG